MSIRDAFGGKMKPLNACSLACLAALMAILPSGCSNLDSNKNGSTNDGVVSFNRGQLIATAKAPLKRTWAAVRKAAKEMGMSVEQLQYTPPSALMVAWTSVGRRIEVHLKKSGYSSTSVDLEMGPGGDEVIGRVFLSKLQNLL